MEYLEELKSSRFPPDRPVSSLRYESHQPPLFYVVAALPLRLASSATLETQVRLLRLLSLVAGVVPIVAAYFLARTIFPEDHFVQAGAPVLMLVPQHIAIAASVNNDMLAEGVISLVLLGLVQLVARESVFGVGFSGGVFKVWSLIGVLVGVTLLAKTTIYFSAVLAAAALFMIWRPIGGDVRQWRGWAVTVTYVYLVALAVSGVWFRRNLSLYGWPDVLGLGRHSQVVAGQPTPDGPLLQASATFVVTTFRSFWLQLGWMSLPAEEWVYPLLAGLTALALAGLGLFVKRTFSGRRELGEGQAQGLALAGLTVLLVFLEMAFYNLQFIQPQGRYLFPAMPALAILFALGISGLFGDRLRWPVLAAVGAGLVALNLRAIVYYLPMLSPPL